MDEDSKEKFKFKEKHEKEKIKEEIRKEIAPEKVKESANESFKEREMAEKESLKESLQESFPDSSVIMSADKSVSTYGMPDLADYQRAVTYDIIFNSLLEKKMQAMKRDCEERKRSKRLKRKSIGRIFFAKRLFSSMDSRKTSSFSETNIAEELHARTEPSTPQKAMKSLTKTANRAKIQQRSKSQDIEVDTHSLKSSSQRSYKSRTRSKSNTASSESPKPATSSSSAAAPAAAALAQNDDSVTSTLSNSSDKVVKRNLLVQAQTHTPNDVHINSSSSGDSKYAQNPSNGISAALPPLSIDYTQDTTSLASGYENGTGARIHSSTMADDSLTSIRDSIESLSFNSSRCTVSFGATEVIPQELDHNMYERLKAAKRQRILEAKSISAQCSPILPPRHVIKTMVHAPMSPPITKISAQPAVNIIEPIITPTATTTSTTSTTATSTSPGELQFTTRPRFLPNQYSYTDSIFESRNISRQNTSEDSANLTVSTLLNQSDSLSLNAPLQNFLPAEVKFTGKQVSINDRFKSKSTSLLVGNGRTRPPPLPPPPFETVQNSPSDKHSPTATTATLQTQALPLEQLQQLHITSNIRYNKYPQQQEEKSVMNQNLKLTSSSAAAAIKPSLAISSTSTKATPSQPSLSSSPPPSLHIVTVTSTSTSLPHQYPVIDTADMTTTNTTTTTTTNASLPAPSYYLSSVSPSTLRNGTLVNGAIVASSSVPSDTAKLHRMTSTSTGSSIAPTGCCTTTKSSSRLKEKQRFKPAVALGQSGSDDEYRKKKRKYKRYHRCSDPVLVYPTPSGLQHCILSMPPNDPIQYPYTEDYPYDMQLQIESDKNDDLEKIVPSDSTKRRHHKHRHHRHKKRHRHKKPKILVHDLETQEVKVIDPDDLPQRARWTIIATACLLLLMCLMLVGITLRMAPIIDDMEQAVSNYSTFFACY